jgi:hypothetical protein
MRCGLLLVAGLVSIATGLPEPANAGPRSLPGALFGVLTRPLGAVLGATRRVVRPPAALTSRRQAIRAAQRRRAVTARELAAPAAAGAAAAVVVGSAIPSPAEAVPLPVPAPPRPVALAEPEPLAESALNPPSPAAAPLTPAAPTSIAAPVSLPPPSSSAFTDVVGFVLWPDSYGDRLRSRGLGDITAAMFGANGGTVSVCKDIGSLDPTWPAQQIEETIKPTDEQAHLITRLRTTIGEAVASLKKTCSDEAQKSAVERVRLVQGMLWTVRDGALAVRAPLVALLGSLSEEQKKALNTAYGSGKTADGRSDALTRMCAAQSKEMPLRRIEKDLQTTAAQKTSLQNLQRKSFEMGQYLMASCLKAVPAAPIERLDMAADRLTAVVFAASNISLALNEFYAQLGDQQKQKFDSLSM